MFEATDVLLNIEAFFIGTFPPPDVDDFLATYEYQGAAADEPEWLTSYR